MQRGTLDMEQRLCGLFAMLLFLYAFTQASKALTKVSGTRRAQQRDKHFLYCSTIRQGSTCAARTDTKCTEFRLPTKHRFVHMNFVWDSESLSFSADRARLIVRKICRMARALRAARDLRSSLGTENRIAIHIFQ